MSVARSTSAARPLSRRRLMQGAAAGAAAVAFPTIVPSSVLGADGQKPPSERITLGFIGMGKMASTHLGFFLGRTDNQVLTICDVDETRRTHFSRSVDDKYKSLNREVAKGCDPCGDYREVLDRKDVDAVVIATPDHWHAIPLIEAAKAKKDIYCEKPLTLTIEEAKTAIEAVRKHGVVFQTGSQQRSEGPFAEVVQRIHEGQLGKIKKVYVALGGTHSNPCELPAEEPAAKIDWNQWLGQAPQRPYHSRLAHAGEMPDKYPFNPGWREYREFSGGFVTDWGAHHIDITQWALGMDGSGPSEILPPQDSNADFGVRMIYRGSPVGDEIVVEHVEFLPGINDEKQKAKEQKNGILFVGEKGQIFVNRSGAKAEPAELLEQETKVRLPKMSQQKKGIHKVNWLECIFSRERPKVDVHIGAGSVTACHLVNLAYWHRQPMKWDPKAWKFADASQNAWLTRERRKGFELPSIG